jgi:hypothetical protein
MNAHDGTLTSGEWMVGEGSKLLYAEGGKFTGQVTALDAERQFAFAPADPRHEELRVAVVVENSKPETVIRLTVRDPQGNEQSVDSVPQPGGSDKRVLSFADPAAGNWVAKARLQSGAAESFKLYWCTDGLAISSEVGAACAAVQD